jgi:hypothetical protein
LKSWSVIETLPAITLVKTDARLFPAASVRLINIFVAET